MMILMILGWWLVGILLVFGVIWMGGDDIRVNDILPLVVVGVVGPFILVVVIAVMVSDIELVCGEKNVIVIRGRGGK